MNDDAGILKGRSSSELMYTGKNADGSTAYYVYCASYNSLTSSSSSDATTFKNWVDANCTDTSIPIIVIGHVPLHNQRNDNGGAVAWNKALNYAATGEETTSSGKEIIRDVIYLHGHNHTTESNREFFVPRGSTMQIYNSSNSSYIYYTYTTAGYLRNNTSATLIAIDSANITISKYKSGSVTSTYSTSSFSDTYDTAATHTIERVDSSHGETVVEDVEVNEGTTTQQIDVTCKVDGTVVTPTAVTYTVKSDASGIIDSISDTGLITFKSGKTGTATVTVSWTYISGAKAAGDTYTGSKDITVTVKASGGGSTETVYVLTDTWTIGNKYLIVGSGTAGNSNALTHSSGTVGADDVTIHDKTELTDDVYIEAGDVDATSIWTPTTSGSYTKLINTVDEVKYYLQITTSSYTLSAASGETYEDNSWTFGSNALKTTYTSGTNNRERWVKYSDGTFSGAASSSATIYLYEETVINKTVSYDFTANDVTAMLNEDGSINNKTISATLTANGEAVAPVALSYAVKTDGSGIIDNISDDGVITFTGNIGTATVTVSYSYAPASGEPVTGFADISVTVKEYEEHNWSTHPVWVWAEDFSTATAKFSCLDDGCTEEYTANAEIVLTENDPSCQEAKIYTYTATAVGPDGETYTDVKTTGGEHEVAIYKLASSLTAGKEYLIVSTASAGNGYVLTNNNGSIAASSVTIHEPEEHEDINVNYIVSDDVTEGTKWIPTTNSSGFTIVNVLNGVTYYLEAAGQSSALSIPSTQAYSSRYWTYNNNNLAFNGGTQTHYVYYTNGNFASTNSGAQTVYIYERATMHEGEYGPHDYHYDGMTYNDGYETAYGTFTCSVCGTTATVPADVTWEDKDENCERPYRTQYVATISTKESLDGQEHIDDSKYVQKQKPKTSMATATVYVPTTKVTAGKNYLIVSANTEQNGAHALNRQNSSTVGDTSVNILYGSVNGTDRVYIQTVASTAIWTASTTSNYYRFQNSNYYLRYYNSSLSLSNTINNYSRWNIGTNTIYYANSGTNIYIRYNNGWGIQQRTSVNVYLFEELSGATIQVTTYEDAPALGHTFGENSHTEAKDATCTEAGNIEYWTCDTCGKHFTTADTSPTATALSVEEITIPALGHTWGEPTWSWAGDGSSAAATFVCTRDESHVCTETDNAPEGVVNADGSTTYTATVILDGHTYTDEKTVSAPHEHAYGEPNWTWADDYSSATATFTCTEGDDTQTVTDEAPVETQISAATCTADRVVTYAATVTFNGEAYAASSGNVILVNTALGHDYVATVIAPTCTEGGYTTHTCSRCGDSYTDNDTEALGHDFGEWTQTTAPTCTEKGEEIRTCSRCDATETRAVEALGHDYDAVVTDPTCTEQGYTTHTCSRCDDSYVDAYVDAPGHTAVTDAAVAPTCTTTGLTEGSHCSVCNEVLVAQEVVPATGHTAVTDAAVAPTCTETGLTEGSHCSVCNEVLVAQEVVSATGHTAVTDAAVAPTCTTTGLTEGSHCSVCNEVLVAQEVVPALGHDYDAVVTAPTCTEQGYTTHTCSRCDDSYVDTYVDALGHDFGEWTETTAPTCTEKGEETRTCSRCDATETREVAALDHAWGDPTYKWADDNTSVTATRV